MVHVLEGGAHPRADHGRRSMDVLRTLDRGVSRLRPRTVEPLGAQVRDRGDVLHAPQVRPQAVPGAVHRTAVHCRRDAHFPDVPLRAPGGKARTVTMMPVVAVLHPFTQLGWLAWSIHPSTVVGIAALGGLYLLRASRAKAGEKLS